MEGETAPWWMAGSVAALWVVRETWTAYLSRKKDQTDTNGSVTLVAGLTERVEHLEKAQREMAASLDAEITARQKAQEEAHRLRLRIMTLESLLRQLGAVVPPEPTT